MGKNYLLSVIIPIYNKGPYLKDCLNSVLSQSYKNIEVICIDDGSTDNSISIISEYIKKDKRVTLYRSKHLGPSSARNIGINKCNGDYIHFMDADDLIKPNTYKTIFTLMQIYKNVDLFIFYIYDFILMNNGLKKINISSDFKNYFNSDNCQYFRLIDNPYYSIEKCGNGVNVANKILSSKIIKKYNLLFDNKLNFYEDSDFYYKFTSHAKYILATPYDFYCYRRNVDGQQTRIKENEVGIYCSIFKVYYNSFNEYKKINNNCLYFYIRSVLNIIFGSYKAITNFDAKYYANKELLNFISKNKNDKIFNNALSFHYNDISLAKFNNYSLTTNEDFNKKYEEEHKKYEEEHKKYEEEHKKYEEERKDKENLIHSETFKLGKILIYPFRCIKKVIKRK